MDVRRLGMSFMCGVFVILMFTIENIFHHVKNIKSGIQKRHFFHHKLINASSSVISDQNQQMNIYINTYKILLTQSEFAHSFYHQRYTVNLFSERNLLTMENKFSRNYRNIWKF